MSYYALKDVDNSEIGAGVSYIPPFIPSEADKFYSKVIAAYENVIADRDAEIAKLREENARLREALEPFSTFAGAVFSRNFNSHDDVMELDPGNGDWVALSAGDFFEARRALAKATPSLHEGERDDG